MKAWNTWRTAKKILLFGLLGVLTVLSGALNRMFSGDVYPYLSQTRTVGLEALERSQGVTTDGTAWFFSGKDVLVKVSLDDKTILARNKNAIPDELRTQYGSAHIGGISYANGYVYAAIEDSHIWQYPLVALFDGETLTYTGKFVLLPGKDSTAENAMTHGVPWVTCDVLRGLFYVAQCDDADRIFAYDLNTMEYVRSIPLSEPVDEIQGAEMWSGRMYAATNDATRAVYKIDLETGNVEKYFDRILYRPRLIDNFGGEGEDITVLPMADGSVFHALDIGALFIDANLRHYAPLPSDLPAWIDDVKPVPRPNVTYLDKYFLDILKSGAYTLDAELTADGYSMAMTTYADADNFAFKIGMGDALTSSVELPEFIKNLGDIRLITTNSQTDPHIYLAWTGGYAELTSESVDDFKEMLSVGENFDLMSFSSFDSLEYCGMQAYSGYVMEMYKSSEDNLLYCFYFNAEGLVRFDIIDLTSGKVTETVLTRLTAGVTDKNAFKVSGRKFTMEELEKLFGN